MPQTTCSVAGCESDACSRGMCSSHYRRWKRYGDALGGGPTRERAAGLSCSVADCTRPVHACGLCNMHHLRKRKHGDPGVIGRPGPAPQIGPKPSCSIAGCAKPAAARGWCKTHWARWKRNGSPVATKQRTTCSIEGCGRKHMAQGWCLLHYYRWVRQGDPLKLWERPPHEPRTCSREGCTTIAKSRGLCSRHYLRQLRAEKPGHYLALARAWRAANRHKAADYASNYVARKHGMWIEAIDRRVVFDRDAGVCGLCRMPVSFEDFHVDHVIPLARGGEHSYANVRLAHPRCNRIKGQRLLSELPADFALLLAA